MHIHVCGYRREIRLHHQRGTAGRSVLDSSQRSRRMRQQTRATIGHTEIRERTVPAEIEGAHLRRRFAAGRCKRLLLLLLLFDPSVSRITINKL